MELRERTIEATEEIRQVGPSGHGGAAERNREASDLISSGRAAIERALSRDSRQYLEQNKQRGGQ